MAENSGENAGNLPPQPQFEISSDQPQEQASGQEALTERAIEKRQVSEGAPTKQTPKFPVPQTPQAAPPPAQQGQQPTQIQPPASAASTGLHAQDTDLIEKEWVERAKTIVAQTQDDPFKQKNEMSKMKADYIKKRFNKTIPVDDSKKS
jgi:hypothetical protein